jgi:23S rRNA (cytosine1962-C5)-methyltransferase
MNQDILDSNRIWRAFAGKPDGCNGVIIDVLGSYVWIRIFDPAAAVRVDEIMAAVALQFGDRFVYCSHRMRPDSVGSDDDARFVWKFPAEIPPARLATEQYEQRGQRDGLRAMNFEIRPAPEDDFGIYADGRAARQWLGLNAHGRWVLNLFAYTCGFGVAAMVGGASKVTNVDYSKDYLSWGMDNARLNGTTFAVVPEDCLKYLRRLQARITKGTLERPDLIVLDPPAFLIGRGSARLNRNVFPEMLASCLAILSSNGRLLVSCNDRYLNVSESAPFIDLLNKIAASSSFDLAIKKVQQSVDVVGRNAGESDGFYLPAQFWEVSLA